MQDECIEKIRGLTGKSKVLFVQRGNVAIRLALKLAKKLGYRIVLLQDQGGWITYRQFCKKENLEYQNIKTGYGLISPKTLGNYSDCILLINSMPGYAALQKMRELARIAMKQNIFIINDASGSIGTDEAMYGDLVLGSFAKDKPVNIDKHAGFIATDNPEHFEFLEKNNLPQGISIDFIGLLGRLQGLNKRLSDLNGIRNKLIQQLEASEFANNIMHKDKKDYGNGINVIVKSKTERQKEKLIKIAEKEKLEFTLCPRGIRVNERAVSFEIKRK
jgi:hypothetical protein